MSDAEPPVDDEIVAHTDPDDLDDDVKISAEARTFVLLTTAAALAAFDLGFDLGAFDNVDHRKLWAIWILSLVAIAANTILRDAHYRLGGVWQLALAIPTVWVIADAVTDDNDSPFLIAALIAALLALPFALYVLARLLAGDYFRLTGRLRVAIVVLTAAAMAIGWVVGTEHPRFLTCDDFARAGEFVPGNCRPE